MNGRVNVTGMKNKLADTFARVDKIKGEPELLSDYAKYLCILVSGYLENSIFELTMEHVRQRSSPSVQSYAESRLSSFTNANCQKIITLLGTFDSDWRSGLEKFLVDDVKDSVDSVVNLRNKISHGEYVGLTMARVIDYYKRVDKVVDYITNLVAPL